MMQRIASFLRQGPYDEMGGWLRGFLISVVAAVFLTFAGAFGSSEMPPGVRFIYWLGLLLLGWLWGVLVSRFFFPRRRRRLQGLWWRVIAVSAVVSPPYTGVVILVSRLALSPNLRPSSVLQVLLAVLVISLVMTTLNVLIESRTVTTAASTEPPKFLERLPLRLRGAEVWAVEAEDHYLRLHTSKGQDLILLRLADAVAELEGIEGAQVHRSWWVARDAITGARRGDGRATLTLKDGSEVPVSRTYAGLLRERRWI